MQGVADSSSAVSTKKPLPRKGSGFFIKARGFECNLLEEQYVIRRRRHVITPQHASLYKYFTLVTEAFLPDPLGDQVIYRVDIVYHEKCTNKIVLG